MSSKKSITEDKVEVIDMEETKKRIVLPDGSITTLDEILTSLVDLTGDQQFDIFITTILKEFNDLREEADNIYEMARASSESTKEFTYMNVQLKALSIKQKALEKAAEVIKMVVNYKIQLSKRAIISKVSDSEDDSENEGNLYGNLLKIVDGGKS